MDFLCKLTWLLFNLHLINSIPVIDIKRTVAQKPAPNLILISFDGFRWDYLENNTLPFIQEHFVRQGVKVNHGLKNAFTTVTFPNHWTLATGLYPESHGIVGNVIYDPILNETFYDLGKNDNDTRWFGQNPDAIPIWILNELSENSRKSGIIGGFPGANVPIRNKTVTYSEDYFNNYDPYDKIDRLVRLFTQEEENRINFGVLYFPEPDETGHEFGPYSNETRAMLEKCDLLVGYLIFRLQNEGLYEKMNIILTSDHGMDTASFEHSLDLSDYVDITKFKSYGGLTQINIFPNNPNDLDEIYNALSKVPHYNIYKREQVPARLNYRNNVRIGPLVMFGDVGYETFKTGRKKFNWKEWKGDHGGDNQQLSMHPVFVARGPAFKSNYVTNLTLNSVDVYSLMSYILDLDHPVSNNGSFANISDLVSPDLLSYNSFAQELMSLVDLKITGFYERIVVFQPRRRFVIQVYVSDMEETILKTRLVQDLYSFIFLLLIFVIILSLCK